MSELVTIYDVHPDNISEIIQLLESRHLHPVVVDDVGKMGVYRSHTVRIAVPETERDIAAHILAEAEQRNTTRLSGLVKVTNRIILLIIALLVLAAIVGFIDQQGKWFFAVWILITVLLAAVLIHRAWGDKSRQMKQ